MGGWKDPEKAKAYFREYYQRNIEKKKAAQAALTPEQRKRNAARERARYAADPKKHAERNKVTKAAWVLANQERIKRKNAEYYQRNKARQYAHVATRRAHQIKATPPWADLEAIRAVYAEAARRRATGEDVHVDHVIPLRNKKVCGLHVANNLRIIPAKENLQKLNKFEGE